MTQKYRWLAALALLLAFGACAVAAEEEEEEAPPPKPTIVELLPPPHAVPVQMPFLPIASPVAWSYLFPIQPPCPAPFPVAAFAGAGQDFSVCPACPGCGACMCRQVAQVAQVAQEDAAQYTVEMKVVKPGARGVNDVMMCPRLTVLDGQTATIQTTGVASAKENSTLQMQATMRRRGNYGLLSLTVTDVQVQVGAEAGPRTHTETTESQCNIQFGKPCKVALKKDADGTETTWMEVTVNECPHDENIQRTANIQAAPGANTSDMDDAYDFRDAIGEIVGEVLDTIGDAAASLFGTESWDEETTPATAQDLPQPPQFMPPPFPLPNELAVANAVRPNCGSACVQCVATEAVKKPAMHVAIDATHDRKSVEMSDGARRFKASADRLTVHDDCILLEGDVRGESCDDSCHECMTIKADKIMVQHKDDGMEIHVLGGGVGLFP